MKPKQDTKVEVDKLVRNIKRATRRKFSAERESVTILTEATPSFIHTQSPATLGMPEYVRTDS